MRRTLCLFAVASAGACFNPSPLDPEEPATSAAPTTGQPPAPTTSADPPSTTTSTISTTSTTSTSTTDATTTLDDPTTATTETTGPPEADCGPFTPGTDLNVCTATYLGAAADDRANAVAIAPDGTIFVAGVFPGQDFAAPVLGIGDAAVLRLAPDGAAVQMVTRFDGTLLDLAVHPLVAGVVAVVGTSGVTQLDADGTVAWNLLVPDVTRVSIGADGTVAALATPNVFIYDGTGGSLGGFEVPDVSLSDLVLVQQPDPPLVVLTGNRSGPALMPCTLYSMPGLAAFTYDGTFAWDAYNWNAELAAQNNICEPASATRVNLGADGHLYYTGTSRGPGSAHDREPGAVGTPATKNVQSDRYNTLADPGNNTKAVGYYARFDASTGVHLAGQYVVARDTTTLPPDTATTSTLLSIEATATSDGRVLLVGDIAFALAERGTQTIDGEPVGPYAELEPFLLVASPDLESRLAWTPLTAGGPGNVAGLAVGPDSAAVITNQSADDLTQGRLFTVAALQPEPGGQSEAHLVVLPTSAE